MKFVRQADMSASYIDPESGEECWHRPHYVEEPLVEFWVEACRHSGLALEVEDAPDGAMFDPGGMIFQGEPRVHIVTRGQLLICYLRSADTLVPLLRRAGRWKKGVVGPPHCLVRGAFKHTLLTRETACAAAELFASEAERRAGEADAWWRKRDEALQAHGVVDAMALKNPVAAVQHEARRAAEGAHHGA